jgi:hypothetical protein
MDGGRTWRRITDTSVASIFGTMDVQHIGGCDGGTFGGGGGQMLMPSAHRWFLSNPSPPESTTGGFGFEPYIHYGLLFRSIDQGQSWAPTGTWKASASSARVHPTPIAALSGDYLLAEDPNGRLILSGDGGNTFSRTVMDSVFRREIWPNRRVDSVGEVIDSISFPGIYIFDNSDLYHWTLIPWNGVSVDSTSKVRGLHVLTSSNFGTTWEIHHAPVAGSGREGLSENGFLQFLKGTPKVYFVPTGSESTRLEGDAYPCYSCFGVSDSFKISHSPLNITWMYSTDYGASWTFYTQYAALRRAFEVVQNDEVWITRRSANARSILDPAFILSRTSDNGVTWEEDSSTLRGLEAEKLDGRIITFSDPRHGWIAATAGDPDAGGRHVFILRYDASEQPAGVEYTQNEFTKFLYKIYPNPSAQDVHLQIFAPRVVSKVEIYDLLGRQLYPPYTLEGNRATVKVLYLTEGTYITRLSYQYGDYSGTYTLPLIVQH